MGAAGIVLGGASADLLLLRVGDDVVVVRPESDGVAVRTSKDLDPSRRSAAVTLSSAAGGPRHVIGGPHGRGRPWPVPWARRKRSGVRRPAPTRPWPTPRSGCSSGGPSAPSKPSSTTAPTCWLRPSWPPRRSGTPPGPADDALDEFSSWPPWPPPGLRAGRAERGDEHPDPRRHRVHLGARCPSLPPPGPGPRRVVRLPGDAADVTARRPGARPARSRWTCRPRPRHPGRGARGGRSARRALRA